MITRRTSRRTRWRRVDRTHDREILQLAVPAFLALVAEPLFLLADAAIVGHLGTPQLAALGIASAVLATLVSLCIFLAYGTTASVARAVGAGQPQVALAQGIAGLWLATAIGLVLSIMTVPAASWIVGLFDPSPAVSELALTYLRIALLGVTPMLLVLAATGVLRGLQDTRTPLVVAVAGNLINIATNLVLVYGIGDFDGYGIAGSAVGTLIAQVLSAIALVTVVVIAARRQQTRLGPRVLAIVHAGRAGVPLLVRTLLLRASLLVMTYAAARLGDADLAAMQLALTIWTFLAFVLDAVAIAAQAITGRYLGAGDAAGVRAVTRRMQQWGWCSGLATGVLLAALSPALGPLFTGDEDVRALLTSVLLVAALAQPLAGIVFVLDGVLIGAGDAVFLAWAQLGSIALFAPAVYLLQTGAAEPGLVWLWIAFAGLFMGVRAATLLARARGDRWMRLGA